MQRSGIVLLVSSLTLWVAVTALAERVPQQPPPEVVAELGLNYQIPDSFFPSKDFQAGRVADLAHDYDVIKYILEIRLSPSELINKLKGHATIQAKSGVSSLNTLSLDLAGLVVDSCKVNSRLTTFGRAGDKLNLTLDRAYKSGELFTAEVYYHGYPLAGLYFSYNKYGSPIYYTMVEPDRSKNWFPCYDQPSDKALSEVICTVPAGNEVISNGNLVNISNNPDKSVTYHWQENYPIATYLISLAAGNYAQIRDFMSLQNQDLSLSYWVYPQDSAKAVYDFQTVPEIISLFSELFGEYPFQAEKFSIAQAGLSGGMENQTCVSWGFPIEGNYTYEAIVAHEISHQWWGDLVTISDFGNMWLKEGLATYCEALWKEHHYGLDRFKGHMTGLEWHVLNDSLGSVSCPIYNPPPEYLFGKGVYRKGAWVMHMLRHVIGDNNFLNGLKAYAQQHAYSTANTEEFKNAMEEQSGQDLDWFFNQWVYSPNFPKYKWSWVYTYLQGKYYLDISIYQGQTAPLFYQMPVDFELTNASGKSRLSLFNSSRYQTYSFVLDDQPSGLIFDPDNWLLGVQAQSTYPAIAGDLTQDGQVRLNDVIFLVNLLFNKGPRPSPAALADVDGNCRVTIADIIYLSNYLSNKGPQPKIGCP